MDKIKQIYFMNPLLANIRKEKLNIGRIKRAEKQKEIDEYLDVQFIIEQKDVRAEIDAEENNLNYEKEDDEMLACLEEIEPLDFW